jgi:hypothetical protein
MGDEIVKEYGNKTIKVKGKTKMKVFKCPYLGCDAFFFTRKELDTHLVLEHGEMPSSFLLSDRNLNNGIKKYFDRYELIKAHNKIQKAEIKRLMEVVKIYFQKTKEFFGGKKEEKIKL